MEKFTYIGKDKNSKNKRGTIEAYSREEAVRILQAQGLYVISIVPHSERGKVKTKSWGVKYVHTSIKLEDLALFARQLSTLLSAGVPLLRSLEVVSSQCGSRKLTLVLSNIGKDIKGGLSLTEAIAKYPAVFSSLWRGLIETGEASGNLSGVLEKLAGYLELRQEFLRRLVSAIIYPVILLVAAVGALLFFSLVIIPKFQEIFAQFNVRLPFMTELLFNFVTFVRKNFIVVSLLIAAAVFALRSSLSTKKGKEFLDKLALSFPFLNTFFYTYFLERFSSTTFILFESGVPVVYALDVVQRSIGNVVFENILGNIREKVRAGKSLSSELANANFFPPMVIEMTAVGEEVGNFPEMFSKISRHYQTALQTKVERFTSFFEPAMILFMGLIIGVIVISLFLPLFQVASAMK
ncbi:MAG: type II secretion system F family protein [Candidatus Omnitrophica bacterium]|nr:type II secretion system F family protein [Candidatus Omnitrophota bacterium]